MNKFLKNFKDVLKSTGLSEKFAEKNLSAAEYKVLREAYQKTAGSSFEADFKAYEQEQADLRDAKVTEEGLKELAQMMGKEAPATASASDLTAILKEGFKELKEQMVALGSRAQNDTPSATGKTVINISGPHTDKFAFGIQHPTFAASKRYNRIAIMGALPQSEPTKKETEEFRNDFGSYTDSLAKRYAELCRTNSLTAVMESTMDYSRLNDDDLGQHYFTRRQDALIAQIAALPDISRIFPRVSNVQDGSVLTNVLFTELSQAYQSGHNFKGDTTFVPEKAFVHDVMFKYKFNDMKFIEKSYLAYLNTTGSKAPKWSLIEWLVLEMVKQLRNEEIRRNVMGCRVEPVAGAKNLAIFAATGVIYRILGYYNEKKVLPFMDEELAEYDSTNIGDVLEAFAAEIHSRVEGNAGEYIIFVNDKHKPWFKQWYTAKYGQNANFDGVQFRVPDYDNPIEFVPGMPGWLTFIFAALPGNIVTLENVPGEAYNIQFQQDLESVIAYSTWKSGAGAGYSGKPYSSLAELKAADAETQVIFCNFPSETLAADATKATGAKMLIVTGANTKATALTDIEGAKEGVVYRIETAGTANFTSIAKSGKFSELSAAWNPTAAGEWIELWYDKSGSKFHEVARG